MLNSIRNSLSILGKILAVLTIFFLAACTSENENETIDTTVQPDDAAITETVLNELRIARGVDADAISVETEDGIVTLSGDVDNILSKERSASIASSVKGVRSVINNIVVLTDREDSAIAADVEEALLSDPATDTWGIQSSVSGGFVNLSGTTDSWQQKELVSTIVKGVDGVTGVNNNIDINYDETRSDTEIRNEIESAFAWNNRLDAELIEIEVNDGNVELTGSVGSLTEKSLATTIAHVAGVTEVNSAGLEISPELRDEMRDANFLVDKSSEDIEKAICEAMKRDPRVNQEAIEIDVNQGIATLSGSVSNLKAARAAAEIARNTHGVISTRDRVSVENAIVVTPDVNTSDIEIRTQVEEAILRDPYINALGIEVVVEDGVVTLTGEVESYFDKYQADEVASTVNGVEEIVNNIEVDYEELVYEPSFEDWDVIEDEYDYEPVVIEDPDLEEAVLDELRWSPFVNPENITVEVEDGVVTLSGTVLTQNAVEEATEEAYEAGASEVVNNLTIN